MQRRVDPPPQLHSGLSSFPRRRAEDDLTLVTVVMMVLLVNGRGKKEKQENGHRDCVDVKEVEEKMK